MCCGAKPKPKPVTYKSKLDVKGFPSRNFLEKCPEDNICYFDRKYIQVIKNSESFAASTIAKHSSTGSIKRGELCEGDKITFEVSPKADFIKIDAATGNVSAKPTANNKSGTYDIKITLKSADGKSEYRRMQIIVQAPKPPSSKSTCKLVGAEFPSIKLDAIAHKYFLTSTDEELKTN